MSLIPSFRKPRRYYDTRSGVNAPSKNLGSREWIIARSLCLYGYFNLADIPAAERGKALELRLQQWSPFGETGSCSVWHGAAVQVWAWDETRRTELVAAQGLTKARALPEPLLYPKPEADGLRVLQCAEGYEAQHWLDGVLQQSHWWPNPPTTSQWSRFLRSCSLGHDSPLPSPEQLPMLTHPWGRIRRDSVGSLAPQLRYAIPAALIATFAWLGWETGAVWHWSQAAAQVDRQVEELTQTLEPLLDAKSRALEDQQRVVFLEELLGDLTLLELFDVFFRHSPQGQNVELEEWKYSDGLLRVTVVGNNLNPSDLVNSFESVPGFHDVSATSGDLPNSMFIRTRIGDGTE